MFLLEINKAFMDILENFSNQIILCSQYKKNGLFPIFSNGFIYQKNAFNYITSFLKLHFDGFIIQKDNHFPEDNFLELSPYLKKNTIVLINEISNSFHYKEILEISKNNIVIAGFECYASHQNPFNDFLNRYQRILHIPINDIELIINSMLYTQFVNNNYLYSISK